MNSKRLAYIEDLMKDQSYDPDEKYLFTNSYDMDEVRNILRKLYDKEVTVEYSVGGIATSRTGTLIDPKKIIGWTPCEGCDRHDIGLRRPDAVFLGFDMENKIGSYVLDARPDYGEKTLIDIPNRMIVQYRGE